MIQVWCPATNFTFKHPLITTACDHPDMVFGWGAKSVGADACFAHSIALVLDVQPTVFHLEENRSLFRYLGGEAPKHDQAPSAEEIADVAARLMRYERIITHMDMTMQSMARMFPAIEDRLRFCQLGIAEQAPVPKAERFRFLFTSSFHNIGSEDPHIAMRRGGREVLAAFGLVREVMGDAVELVMHLPHRAEQAPPPGVTVLREVMSEDDINALFGSAHVYLLPSYDLHSHSVLRAMSHGCVPLVSDAPGYSELIRHRENGIICAGRMGKECWTGEWGDVRSLDEPNEPRAEYIDALAAWMLELADAGPEIGQWGESIRATVRRERPLARWQAEVCGQIADVVSKARMAA